MFKKIKQAVENWLRDIVAAEVGKIDTTLENEKIALRSQLMVYDAAFKAQLEGLNLAVKHLAEVSEHSQENSKLRDHIAVVNAKFAELSSTLRQLHPVT